MGLAQRGEALTKGRSFINGRTASHEGIVKHGLAENGESGFVHGLIASQKKQLHCWIKKAIFFCRDLTPFL
jgi:hypothetical protein